MVRAVGFHRGLGGFGRGRGGRGGEGAGGGGGVGGGGEGGAGRQSHSRPLDGIPQTSARISGRAGSAIISK